MNYWVLSFVCVLLVAPLRAQEGSGDEDSEEEPETSVVNIRTLLAEGGEEVPSMVSIFEGEEIKPLVSGMRTRFELPPGEYRVAVKARDVEASDTMVVKAEVETELIIVLDAGYLRLRSLAAEGGAELETHYEVYKADALLPETRKRFAAGRTGDFLLPAGSYVVTSKWGAAEVEQTFDVVANQIVKEDLILNAGSLLLSTELADGGEKVRVYYDVSEAETALDGNRKRVTGGSGGQFQVPAGKYLLTTTWGRASTETEVEVKAGEMTNEKILMPAGLLNVTSVNAAGEPVEPFLSIYDAEKLIDGSRKRVSAGTTADHQLLVGEYVIEGTIDDEEVRARGVVRPGERTEVILAPDPS